MRFFYSSRLWVLFSWAIILCLAQDQPYYDDVTCHYQQIPDTLDSLSFLGEDNEFHFHQEFYADTSTQLNKLINFTLSQDSQFRVYVAPHQVDVDLWLYNSSGSTIARSSLNVGTEEVIQALLIPGSYVLRINYFNVWIGNYEATSCDTIVMEMAIVPSATFSRRLLNYPCPTSENLPTFTPKDDGSIDYNSDRDEPSTVFNVRNPSTGSPKVRFVKKWQLSFPEKSNTDAVWEFKAQLGFDFLTGGNLGLIILEHNATAPDPTDLTCLRRRDRSCTPAVGERMNHLTLRQLLEPGDYDLWLYDQVSERASTVTCSPFTLTVEAFSQEVDENPLTCEAIRLPRSLIPGLYADPAGYLHETQNYLIDLSQRVNSIPFSISSNSIMRVRSSPHRVDIDLKITNGRGTVIQYGYSTQGEEGVAVYLPADSAPYNLIITYFGIYQAKFCETMEIEFAIAPTLALNLPSLCNGATNTPPNLSDMQSTLDRTGSYYFVSQGTPYVFAYAGNYARRLVFSQNFTLAQASTINAQLGKNFLLGDLALRIVNNDRVGVAYTPVHDHNVDMITATLENGNYSLEIWTAQVPTASLDTHFPSCAQYNMSIAIKPQQVSGNCWRYRSLPTNLNVPEYLGVDGITHFSGFFLANMTQTQFSLTESMYFQVPVESFLRVWTERHDIIDTDLYLYENSVYKTKSNTNDNEEVIIYQLKANTRYELDILHYHFQSADPHTQLPNCFLYNFQLAISPTNPNPTPCASNLPDASTIPDQLHNVTTYFLLDQQNFTYTQSSSPLWQRVPFHVDDFIYFRARIQYDFVWADLSLYLRTTNETIFASGVNEYNANDLHSILLGPGSYELIIYEPAAMTMPQFRRCVNFDLSVFYQASRSVDAATAQFTSCGVPGLPKTLNTVSELSPLSEYKVHWQHPVLVNVRATKDVTYFQVVNTPALLNVFIPYHLTVDVDIILYNGTGETNSFVWNIGLAQESVSRVLAPGDYTFVTKYYGYRGAALPPPRDCVSFPMEFSLVPTAILESVPSRTTSCRDTALENQLSINTRVSRVYQRQLSNGWNSSTHFTLTSPAQFEFVTRYEFAYAGLDVTLRGVVNEGLTSPVARTYYPQYGFNSAYFHRVLQPGNYTITLLDMLSSDTRLQCGKYSLEYNINTVDVPVDYCDDTLQLPSDLYSAEGGSAPFGGPQDPVDGSVRIFGENFLLEEPRDNYVQFKVPVPSYVRFFSKAPAGNDIDFWVYNDVNRTSGSMVGYSTGTDEVESKVILLTPPAGRNIFLLDVYYFKIVSSVEEPCPSYYFEMAMKPVTTVQQELACPNVLPNPQVPAPYYDLRDDVYEFNDNLIFTRNRIVANTVNNVFTYRITLNVRSNTTIFAAIGYDFLANDFRLRLSDANNSIVSLGSPSGVENRDEYFNFYNLLLGEINPGLYYLDIREDVRSKFNFTEYCHKFSFFFIAFTSALPAVDYVLPPGGINLNPYTDLTITVVLSKAVQLNNVTAYTFITQANVAYLYATDAQETHIQPDIVNLDRIGTTLELIFRSGTLSRGKNYVLYLDATKMRDSNGTPFQAMTNTYHFITSDCSCSGHGRCADNSITCICETGYTGVNCAQCSTGYHLAATVCIPNQVCGATTCNGHGTCDDSRGYPVCICDDGYATPTTNTNGQPQFCTICAAGYDGPPCTKVPDEMERPTRCNAPILPTNLDPYGYLGFDGAVHLSDNYYIDLDTQTHDTYFTLNQESVIRVYTEPHWVDVDIWLYRLKDDGVTIDAYIDNGIYVGLEETIFTIIPGAAAPAGTKYLLRFRYYIWDREHTIDCETFNLDLAISPRTSVSDAASRNSCPGAASLPSPPAVPSATPYTFGDFTTLYNVQANASLAKNRANYFWSFPFTVAPPAGKVALFHAELGYRFLPGDISLLIESGGAATHCGSHGGHMENCTNGANSHNRNSLHEELGPGTYTLWIYEPEPQLTALTNCSQFTFYMDISYVEIETDVFYCDARNLPTSLNVAGFMTPAGTVHIQEDFLLSSSDIQFTLSQTSTLRVAGYTDDSVSLTVRKKIGGFSTSTAYSHNPELLASSLTAGDYILSVARGASVGIRCPTINLELALAPNSVVPNTCPGRESLPQLDPITLPFNFSSGAATSDNDPVSFYAYTNNYVVKQYSFVLDQVSWIDTFIDSDFLTGALKVELTFTVTNGTVARTIYGKHSWNRNGLKQLLDPGRYNLRITRPALGSSNTPASFPPCAEFNFYLYLYPLSTLNNMRCVQEGGEHLPATFNSVRFLGWDNQFDYQATDFKVPPFEDYSFKSKTIRITPKVASVIRVYTEPHVVDIDISLFEVGVTAPLAHGGYSFNNEESFTFELVANHSYALTMYFWKWNSNVPLCSTFNMEVAVVPTPMADNQPKQCDGQGASRFPDGPPASLPSPYEVAVAQYSIQQTANTQVRSPLWRFKLDRVSNFHVELGYFFISGDLQVKLTNVDEDIDYYGVNQLNGNILNVKDLPVGTYTMQIYELAPAPASIIGCSPYTYYIFIEDADVDALLHNPHRLPPTLDTISFLKYTGSTHFQGNYQLFKSGETESITFTVAEESLVRVATTHNVNTLEELSLVFYTGDSAYAFFTESALEIVQPGTYRLDLTRPGFNITGNVGRIVVEFQMAISPLNTLKTLLGSSRTPTPTDCAIKSFDAIQLTPRNSYNWNSDALTVSQAGLTSYSPLSTTTVVLPVDSIFYAQVTYHFLLSDLELNITGHATSNNQFITAEGRNGKNINEIDLFLPAGTYTLTLLTSMPYSANYMSRLGGFCGLFSGKIIIQDAATKDTHTDCSALDTLPWNLNTVDGGTDAFGGPMVGGTVRILGDNFLMPTVSGQVDTIALSVNTPSILSLIARENNAGSVNFNVESGPTTMRLITSPLISVNDYNQRSELYILGTPNKNTTYEVQLSYQSPMRVACPYFGFQANIQPLDEVVRRLVCTSTAPAKTPQYNAVPDASGVYSEFVESFLSPGVLTGNYTLEIKLNLTAQTGASRIIVGFGFSSMSNMFRMRLYQKGAGTSSPYIIGNALYEMSHAKTGLTDVNLLFSGTVRPDVYYLRITHPPLNLPFNTTQGVSYCYPFVYSLEVIPDNDVPYVPDVEPPSGFYLDPTQSLELSISFSTAVYDSQGALQTSANSNAVKNALALQENTNPLGTPIKPTIAQGVQGKYWRVTFPGPFTSKSTYKLTLAPNSLFSVDRAAVRLTSTNLYNMIDTSCSGHGTMERGLCFCDRGYAGEQCDGCNAGFRNKNPGGVLDCQRAVGTLCMEDSCGCLPGHTPCQPLGSCYDSTGYIQCVCISQGLDPAQNCTGCKAGFSNFDAGCIPIGTECPKCIHGTCNQATKKCDCDKGYSGSDCSIEDHYVAPSTPGDGSSAGLTFLKVASLIAVLVMIAITIAFMVYRRIAKKRRPYMHMEGFSIDDESSSSELTTLDEVDP
eukprot:TRINITY_DN853_c0_g1_i1.p1 TRINITY_DN853_c0_g1~~TRINITY_DN853_c0_g1_i1.p1  ORF type:complete len:3439 (+),score=826.93 TRINITY_DN853_c0_g1_i1:91-10407(+)